MERENYYLLLELSVDPPELDSRKIDEAIKKKQALWSRYRNHPTKAIQSKQYIGMIPEMREILNNPELRKKEIEDAKKILIQRDVSRYEKIDRHIKILTSKGSITKKEISWIAKINSIDEAIVRDRVKKNEAFNLINYKISSLLSKGKQIPVKEIKNLAKKYTMTEDQIRELIKNKENEKYSEIENYTRSCGIKGYITESAITKIAKIYSVREVDILSHLECPIKPATHKIHQQTESIDKSLERLINDSLKIIRKSSLYEFLEVSHTSSLGELQKAAKEKEITIRRVGHKDAVTTASGALAGHCIVIFSAEKSRKAYDISLMQAHMSEIDSDINAAGADGKIRWEYFQTLVKNAVKMDIDFEKAYDYIKAYCSKEKLKLNEKKKLLTFKGRNIIINEQWNIALTPKAPAFWILVAVALAIVFSVIATAVMSMRVMEAQRVKKEYKNTLISIEQIQDLEEREKALIRFVKEYENSDYAEDEIADIGEKLRQIRAQIEKRDYDVIIKDVQKLYKEKHYEDAQTLLDWYLSRYPAGANAADAKKKIEEIPPLIEQRDYEALLSLGKASFSDKIRAYNDYFAKHPEGKHVEDVKKLILTMVEHSFVSFKAELDNCEKQKDWKACIRLCDSFISRFDGTERASEAESFKVKYQKQIQNEDDVSTLRYQAEMKGFDFDGAKKIYEEYVKANPESSAYMKKIIAEDLADLDRKHKEYIRQEKEWEDLLSHSKNSLKKLADRVQKLETYIEKNPDGRHTSEAMTILTDLKEKYKIEAEEIRKERERKDWQQIAASVSNTSLNITEKIAGVENFIRKYPSGEYTSKAESILERLREEKRIENERLMAKQTQMARIQAEMNFIKSQIPNTGGRYVDNGNATITDRKTGLVWCLVDSSVVLGMCLDYQGARDYVESLNTGGYTDWRLPTATELAGIYKSAPFFPSGDFKWFWSSETIWHGWNKKVYIVTTTQETAWNKEQAELSKCGAVRAVRK